MREDGRPYYRHDDEPKDVVEGCEVAPKCEGPCRERNYGNGTCICLSYYYWREMRKKGKKKLRRSRRRIYTTRAEYLKGPNLR